MLWGGTQGHTVLQHCSLHPVLCSFFACCKSPKTCTKTHGSQCPFHSVYGQRWYIYDCISQSNPHTWVLEHLVIRQGLCLLISPSLGSHHWIAFAGHWLLLMSVPDLITKSPCPLSQEAPWIQMTLSQECHPGGEVLSQYTSLNKKHHLHTLACLAPFMELTH